MSWCLVLLLLLTGVTQNRMVLGWAEEKMRLPLQEQQQVRLLLLDADTSAMSLWF